MGFVSQYTFNTAVEELIFRFGNRTDLTSRAGEWINAAQQRVARSLIDMPELEDIIEEFTVTENIPIYDLRTTAPALVNIIGLRTIKNNETGYRLRRFPWYEFRSLVNQAGAQPSRWTRRGNYLAFDPKPDETVTMLIEYRRRPQMDVLETPSEWQEDLIKLATSIGWSSLGEHERSRAILAELPATLLQSWQQPLTQEQWEAFYDPDLSFLPRGWEAYQV